MGPLKIFALAVAMFFCSAVTASEQFVAYALTNMYAHSQTSSIKQIVLDEFEGDNYDRGQHSFTHNLWELGGLYDSFKVAVLARYDYTLNYTEDVADLVYADRNDIPIGKNRTYDLYLDAVHMRSTGLKLGYEYAVSDSFSVSIDISGLQVTSYITGDINGLVEVTDDDYVGDIHLDYVYSKDKLLDRVADRPKGYGATLDFALNAQLSRELAVKFEVIDLVNHLKIKDAPYTTADATSNRWSFSPDGLIDVKPVLTGVEGYRDQRLKLEPRYLIASDYQLDEVWTVGVGLFHYDDYTYPSIRGVFSMNNGYSILTKLEFITEAIELGVQSAGWHLALMSDNINFSDAKTFGINASYQY